MPRTRWPNNARYNHSAELRAWLAGEGCRIRPVYLPAYSPILDLIERLRRLLKETVLRNECSPSHTVFQVEIESFFAYFDRYHAQIKSLIIDRFHSICRQISQTL